MSTKNKRREKRLEIRKPEIKKDGKKEAIPAGVVNADGGGFYCGWDTVNVNYSIYPENG